MKYWSLFLAAVLALASLDADAARRLGGGQSIGRQSPNVTQRDAGQAPAQPAPGAAQKSQAQQPATAAQTQPARRGFGGMLGGLAAGLGLAWLAHALGFGEGFAIFLLVALLAVVAIAVIGAIARSRSGAARQGGYAFEGAGAGPDSAMPPPQYNPYKVGNDASARPWERGAAPQSEPGRLGASGLRIGSGLEGRQGWGVPAGFDTEGFLAASKRNFITLQDAWDRADVSMLRSMMTDEMLGEIRNQLTERQAQGGQQGRTDVEMLEAQLLGIEELDDEYLASVEFSGMIREQPSAGPSPFREVWNMVKSKSGASGWLVAGVQALQ